TPMLGVDLGGRVKLQQHRGQMAVLGSKLKQPVQIIHTATPEIIVVECLLYMNIVRGVFWPLFTKWYASARISKRKSVSIHSFGRIKMTKIQRNPWRQSPQIRFIWQTPL